jgi:hypothetical protein
LAGTFLVCSNIEWMSMLLIETGSLPSRVALATPGKVSKMTIYVAEVSGRGIAAFDAADEDEAKARLADTALRRDLVLFQNQGRPLWDGVSEIQLRRALPKEAETWQAGYATAAKPGGCGDHQHGLVFLVPVVDPSIFDDDDDNDYDQGD